MAARAAEERLAAAASASAEEGERRLRAALEAVAEMMLTADYVKVKHARRLPAWPQDMQMQTRVSPHGCKPAVRSWAPSSTRIVPFTHAILCHMFAPHMAHGTACLALQSALRALPSGFGAVFLRGGELAGEDAVRGAAAQWAGALRTRVVEELPALPLSR